MNNLKKVYKHLNKEELSTKKIELGIIDEISKQLTQSQQILKKIQSEENDFSKIDKIYKKAESDISKLKKKYSDNREQTSSFYKEMNKSFNLLNKSAKEIGLDVTSLPAYKDYLQIRKNIDKAIDDNQSNWRLVSKYS